MQIRLAATVREPLLLGPVVTGWSIAGEIADNRLFIFAGIKINPN